MDLGCKIAVGAENPAQIERGIQQPIGVVPAIDAQVTVGFSAEHGHPDHRAGITLDRGSFHVPAVAIADLGERLDTDLRLTELLGCVQRFGQAIEQKFPMISGADGRGNPVMRVPSLDLSHIGCLGKLVMEFRIIKLQQFVLDESQQVDFFSGQRRLVHGVGSRRVVIRQLILQLVPDGFQRLVEIFGALSGLQQLKEFPGRFAVRSFSTTERPHRRRLECDFVDVLAGSRSARHAL